MTSGQRLNAKPCVSVMMPCRNAGQFLLASVQSVLAQPECLELLVADGGSTDGTLEQLEEIAASDPRLRIISRSDTGPADALNKAFQAARGTLIGWLNADDLYAPGALARAAHAFQQHPEWLMLIGEGEEFDSNSAQCTPYPTLPPSLGINAFQSHCCICQPSVVFKRSMGLLLGPFDQRWRTAFDFDYWLRAFESFPNRIGYIPHLQGRTRLHADTITSQQRQRVALEATALLARHFGSADATPLHNYGLELQLGLAQLPERESLHAHLSALIAQAKPWLTASALEQLNQTWMLDPSTASGLLEQEQQAAKQELCDQLPVQLLQALHPDLSLEHPGSPAGPHRRLHQAVNRSRSHYRLLQNKQTSAGEGDQAAITPFQQRPFGVNLIGHAFEMFGIGEDIRMAARALQAAGVPCCVIHHPAANGSSCNDRTLEPLICSDPLGGPYAFNWVCMAAPIQARWLRQVGCDSLRERYTISSWPWETQQWPDAWMPLLDVADELWPSSQFTGAALAGPAAEAGRPLHVMPMAAEITDPDRFCNAAARIATRYGLPAETVLFGYGFDLNSTAIRKNPMATLEAFQRAFPLPHLPATFGQECTSHPLSQQVSLLIKTFPPRRFSAEWQWLQARAAEDPRIILIDESLPRDVLLSLYGCCDVFLSLHRSEGFGRGMAEALQMGVDVIATDFGGNTDFCTGPLAHPVLWRKSQIPRGSYPNADGHSWTEPDLDHAVQLCQQVAAQRMATTKKSNVAIHCSDASVLSSYREQFSFMQAGLRYQRRLEELLRKLNADFD